MMLLKASTSEPPLGAVLLARQLRAAPGPVQVQWGADTSMEVGGGVTLTSAASIVRYLARAAPDLHLYGDGPLSRTEVDHWLTWTLGPLACQDEFQEALDYLDDAVKPAESSGQRFLVGDRISAAEYAIYGALFASGRFQGAVSAKKAPKNVLAWYQRMGALPEVKAVVDSLPKDVKPAKPVAPGSASHGHGHGHGHGHKAKGGAGGKAKSAAGGAGAGTPKEASKDEGGKFVDLPDAELGKVVVRFPPEASGYLHIGHAKAVLLNQHYRNHFQGKLILRFDDTNPEKEKEEFEQIILEDLKLLEVQHDHFSRSSDHFEIMINYCEKLLKEGKAYVDDTDAETMKVEREARQNSKNRDTPPAVNLALWEEMKAGSARGLVCAVRAKIDMKSDNGCMRDPTIYRCKTEPHPSTGTKFNVYPTYDFTIPIVDSIEGVTHSLRTTEYMDRDEQFYWFIEALGLRRPYVYAYSRLSMTNTVMSKRKLTWFVESGQVEGWDDPRFPTVRGVLRRGMCVEALKQFILAQGSSRSVNFMEWDKIWAMNKKVIDPKAPRFTAVDKSYHVQVHVSNVKEESVQADKHPKDPAIGQKTVWRGPRVLIDGVDAEALKEGQNATFINWGNLKIRKVVKKADGKVESVEAEPNLEDKDYKKTLKVTWLADTDKATFTPATCVYYDHIISKAVLEKEDNFKDFIGQNTKTDIDVLGDPELASLKKGDIIQLQRKGFFIVDSAYRPASVHTCKPCPIRLIAIPDGTVGSYGPPGKAAAAAAAPAPAAANKKGKKNQAKDAPAAAAPSKTAIASPSADVGAILQRITAQGDKIRQMKADKADKKAIEPEVKALLDLKVQYKAATGQDWKPGASAPAPAATTSSSDSGDSAAALNEQITAQGNKVREVKGAKAGKAVIDAEVKTLLDLKAKFKAATGQDWKPGMTLPTPAAGSASSSAGSSEAGDLGGKIAAQGDKIRQMKGNKADKKMLEPEIKTLLELKEKYKAATGQDWKPGAAPATSAPAKKEASPPAAVESELERDLNARIASQGDIVRKLKSGKADKEDVDANIKILLDLKSKFKEKTGKDWKPAGNNGGDGGKKKEKKPQQPKQQKQQPKKAEADGGAAGQKQTRLGMEAKKEENLADWYSQIIIKSEMLEYYDVSGCYILRPWAFSIWEAIQAFFDAEIKKLGVENCYFPIFVSQSALEKEKEHIADFSPEVAWVTRSGDSEMAEPIAIRPTSETVMYPAYAKWIQSYRDLPLKLNQWNNVVRWEFKHPQPFLRTREFLWQEGHTAFATAEEAQEEVLAILDLYRQIYEDLLAIPVVRGRKTEKEKFAGGDFTTTVEAYISAAGRAIQGGTSHHLGQNFSKMFEVAYEDPETGEKKFVYQNSWGLTTRTIGVLTMVHGDNQGLVLPPKIARIQVVIVPCGITVNLKDEDRKSLYKACEEYESVLKAAGLRVKGDYRENYSPGWKFNHWELKGVPLRLEVGPRDIKNGQYVVVRRDTGDKTTLKKDSAAEDVQKLLQTIQQSMFAKAKRELDEHMSVVTEWADLVSALDRKHLIQAPFCGAIDCEEQIKEMSKQNVVVEEGAPSMGAKSLCVPFNQPADIKPGMKCVLPGCKGKPISYTLFGRSY